MITPFDKYQQLVLQNVIHEDAEQLKIIRELTSIQQALIEEYRKRHSFWRFAHKNQLIEGLYLWGGVGIGKTFMMDCFYQSLPFPKKMRQHFHVFMRDIHLALKNHQGDIDPLPMIAKEIAAKTLVICFDELFVSDIADAMLLGRLFAALFHEGVCLVITSNCAPDDLYKNGLQRLRFLPTIQLIKNSLHIAHIPTTIDYRLRHFKEAGVFYMPLNDETAQKMEKSFSALTMGDAISLEPLVICGRKIPVIKKSEQVVWFDFKDICSIPRSQHDYLEIAQKFKTVFISNIPAIAENQTDVICLFINLIDVLYDAKVKCVISAAESVPDLYVRGQKILEYARTHSRLIEMQSEEYYLG